MTSKKFKRETRIQGDFLGDNKTVVCSYQNQRVVAKVGQAYKNDNGTIIVPIEPARGNNKTRPANIALKNLQFNSSATKHRLEKQLREKLTDNGKKEKKVA